MGGKELFISKQCYQKIKKYFVSEDYEQGGIIGTEHDLFHITHFYPDNDGVFLQSEYVPHTKNINRKIAKWADNNICFCGIVHSHINGCLFLSANDRYYIYKQLSSFQHMPFLWFPVISVVNQKMMHKFYKCYIYNDELCVEQVALNIAKLDIIKRK